MRWAHRGVWCSKIQHLMEAELFAAIVRTPCTVWPRTVMRGKSRKVNSGHNSVPKSARRTEPSSRNPRFAAHLRCVSAKEGLGSQEGTGNHWCPVPFCLRRQTAAFSPVNTGSPRRRAAAMHTPCHGEHPPSKEGVFRLQRRTAVPAEGIPSADGQKGDGKNSELTLAEKGELFYNKINTWEDFL